MAAKQNEKRVDLFSLKKKPSGEMTVSRDNVTEKKTQRPIKDILAGAEGKNTGYEWEDYLRVCEYYNKHPNAPVPNRPETIGKGHYPMREIVAYSQRLKAK